MSHKWTTTLIEDGEDLILPHSDELVEMLGWTEETIIYFIDNKDGTFTLTNKEEHVISDRS